jgi:hypothetical protein
VFSVIIISVQVAIYDTLSSHAHGDAEGVREACGLERELKVFSRASLAGRSNTDAPEVVPPGKALGQGRAHLRVG